ncbi:hypothetical protein [Intrasporangium sp. YIM S08009]|uniref:hypothetical protein n=1 Tax=Intrasporangium zincisolvens TaxID=3080018 RepID=UPI002B05D13A|nr:hypothetical protein [Intrasporangium sp. YIM S08009]
MDATGDATTGVRAVDGYADTLPFATKSRELARPAAAALAIGALSLLPVAVRAGNALGLQAAWDATVAGQDPGPSPVLTVEHVTTNLGTAAFLLAGVLACIWLVRVQRILVRADLVDVYHPDSGLWIMWAVPLGNLVLPARRLAGFDRVLHGTRHASWAVYAWAVCWVPTCSYALWQPRLTSDDVSPLVPLVDWQPGIVVSAWWRLASAVVGFALWATVVVRITRVARAADAETTARLAGSPPCVPVAP